MRAHSLQRPDLSRPKKRMSWPLGHWPVSFVCCFSVFILFGCLGFDTFFAFGAADFVEIAIFVSHNDFGGVKVSRVMGQGSATGWAGFVFPAGGRLGRTSILAQ